MKALITLAVVVALASCNPLKSYQKVATDTFRNSAERALLTVACTSEFPTQLDSPKIVSSGIDSSDYLAVVDAYNILVDTLIAKEEQAESDTAEGTGNTEAFNKMMERARQLDSLRIVKQTIKNFHPPAIIKTQIREVQVRNTAVESQLQARVNACSTENDKLTAKAKDATDKQAATRSTNIWLWIVGGLLLVGNLGQFFSKKTPVA